MQTSARNHLKGTVAAVHVGAVNSEVVVDIGGGHQLAAIVTKESAERLKLAPGKAVYALIKASWPILVKGAAPQTSARNTLCGTVKAVHTGAVNTEVLLTLGDGTELAVIITAGSEKALGLKAADAACALVKASQIILGVD